LHAAGGEERHGEREGLGRGDFPVGTSDVKGKKKIAASMAGSELHEDVQKTT